MNFFLLSTQAKDPFKLAPEFAVYYKIEKKLDHIIHEKYVQGKAVYKHAIPWFNSHISR